MKLYSTKANANRAAKNQGIEDFNVIMNAEGKFFIEVLDDNFELVAAAEAAKVKQLHEEKEILLQQQKETWLAEFVPYNPQLLLPAPVVKKVKPEVVRESKISNPVKMVWEIADSMWGSRRKDIIAACVEAGIAYNTARTQYQAFYKVKVQEGK
jgi:hypothetical protein